MTRNKSQLFTSNYLSDIILAYVTDPPVSSIIMKACFFMVITYPLEKQDNIPKNTPKKQFYVRRHTPPPLQSFPWVVFCR